MRGFPYDFFMDTTIPTFVFLFNEKNERVGVAVVYADGYLIGIRKTSPPIRKMAGLHAGI